MESPDQHAPPADVSIVSRSLLEASSASEQGTSFEASAVPYPVTVIVNVGFSPAESQSEGASCASPTVTSSFAGLCTNSQQTLGKNATSTNSQQALGQNTTSTTEIFPADQGGQFKMSQSGFTPLSNTPVFSASSDIYGGLSKNISPGASSVNIVPKNSSGNIVPGALSSKVIPGVSSSSVIPGVSSGSVIMPEVLSSYIIPGASSSNVMRRVSSGNAVAGVSSSNIMPVGSTGDRTEQGSGGSSQDCTEQGFTSASAHGHESDISTQVSMLGSVFSTDVAEVTASCRPSTSASVTWPSTSGESAAATEQVYHSLPSTSAEPVELNLNLPIQSSSLITAAEDALWKVVRAASILKSVVGQWNHYQHSNASLRRQINRCSNTVMLLQKTSAYATHIGTTAKVIGGMVSVAGFVSQNALLRGIGSKMWKSGCVVKLAGLAGNLLMQMWNNGFQTTLSAHLACLSGFVQNMTHIRSVLEELHLLEARDFLPGRFMPLLLLICPEDLFTYAIHIVRLLISPDHYSALNDFVTMALSTYPSTASLPVQILHQVESYQIFNCLSDLPQPLQYAAAVAHVGKEIFDLFSSLSSVHSRDFLTIRSLLHKLKATSTALMESVERIPLLNVSRSRSTGSDHGSQVRTHRPWRSASTASVLALTPLYMQLPALLKAESQVLFTAPEAADPGWLNEIDEQGDEEDGAPGPSHVPSDSGGSRAQEVETPLQNTSMRVERSRLNAPSAVEVSTGVPETVESDQTRSLEKDGAPGPSNLRSESEK